MITNNFGKALKIFRIERGIRQKDMAVAVDFSASYLSSIEAGNREAPLDFIKTLDRIYRLTADERRALTDALAADSIQKQSDDEQKKSAIKEIVRLASKDGVSAKQLQHLLDTLKDKK